MRKKLKVIDLCSIRYIVHISIYNEWFAWFNTNLRTHDRTLLYLLSLADDSRAMVSLEISPVEKNREIHAKSRQENAQWALEKFNEKHAFFYSMPVLHFQLFRTVHRILDKKIKSFFFEMQRVKNNWLWLAYTNRKWNKICDWVKM